MLTCLGVAQLAERAREARHEDTLSRIGGLLATAVQEDLATAWTLLEREAGPVSEPDTTIAAVQRALAGDTIRALSSDPEGPRASVLFARNDTLVSATAITRSRLLPEAADALPLDLGLYLRGTRIQPVGRVGGPLAGTLPDRIGTSPGWQEETQLWVTAAPASRGSAAAELVVVVRPTTRRRSASTLRTVLAAGVLMSLSLLSAWVGFTGQRGPTSGGPIVTALLLAVLTTLVVSGWIALGESRVAAADVTRELTWVSSLARARGVLEDAVAAQRWLGSTVVRRVGDQAESGSGEPVPGWTLQLPAPQADFPALGQHRDGQRWLVLAGGGGSTVFIAAAPGLPPLLPIALGGSLVVLLGSLVVARTSSVQEFVATGRR